MPGRRFAAVARACLGSPPSRKSGFLASVLTRLLGGSRMYLDDIVACLHKHGQRVTYGGLTHALGYHPRAAQSVGNLMAQRQKNHENSWVVTATTGLPTGYTPSQIDPRLPKSSPPIANPN